MTTTRAGAIHDPQIPDWGSLPGTALQQIFTIHFQTCEARGVQLRIAAEVRLVCR